MTKRKKLMNTKDTQASDSTRQAWNPQTTENNFMSPLAENEKVISSRILEDREPTRLHATGLPDPQLYNGRIDSFRDKTRTQKFQELLDLEEYRELTAIYALRVGHGVSTADLFTDDGIFTVDAVGRPFFTVGGSRAALDEGMKALAAGPNHPLPQACNHLLKVERDHAVAICSNEVRATENGKSMIGFGWYDDVLRREDGRWRFVRRDVRYRYYVPLQQGWAKEPGGSS